MKQTFTDKDHLVIAHTAMMVKHLIYHSLHCHDKHLSAVKQTMMVKNIYHNAISNTILDQYAIELSKDDSILKNSNELMKEFQEWIKNFEIKSKERKKEAH